MFGAYTFKLAKDENNSSDGLSMLIKLRKHNIMPHFTPACSDKVVYTTVDEAHSGSADDVGALLAKLKKDLCIGGYGYLKYVIIGGDQQTYSTMKNLSVKYSDHYEWMYPRPVGRGGCTCTPLSDRNLQTTACKMVHFFKVAGHPL